MNQTRPIVFSLVIMACGLRGIGAPVAPPVAHTAAPAQPPGPDRVAPAQPPGPDRVVPPIPRVATPSVPSGIPLAPPVLTILTGPDLVRTGPGTVKFDAGLLNAFLTPKVEHTFTLKNDTSQPISIGRVHGSCGCETLILSKGGVKSPQATLAPGEQAEVQMAVKLPAGGTGTLRKFAWAYPPASNTPLAEMEIDVSLHEPVSFFPRRLDFGSVANGLEETRSLVATVDSEVLNKGSLPALICTNPDIRITAEGEFQPTIHDGKPAVIQNYRVTLTSHARIGLLSGEISYASAAGQAAASGAHAPIMPQPVSGPPAGIGDSAALLAARPVSILGEVGGRLSATPKMVFFGSIPAGKEALRQVMLSIAATESAKDMTVTTGNAWLKVVLQDLQTPSGKGAPAMRILDVTVSPKAPAGTLKANIEVVSGSGQRLDLPVLADIVGKPLNAVSNTK